MPIYLKIQGDPCALGVLKHALKVHMLESGDDGMHSDTSITEEGDTDDDGPIVAETVHKDNDDNESDADPSDF